MERLWLQYFVTPKELRRKYFRLEDASFFGRVSHLRPYISSNPNFPNRRALCASKKVAMTLYYLKYCGTLSVTANSFGITTNAVLTVINEVCNTIMLYIGPKYMHLPKTRDKGENFRVWTKFGMIQMFGCIDVLTFLLHVPVNTLPNIFVTNNSI